MIGIDTSHPAYRLGKSIARIFAFLQIVVVRVFLLSSAFLTLTLGVMALPAFIKWFLPALGDLPRDNFLQLVVYRIACAIPLWLFSVMVGFVWWLGFKGMRYGRKPGNSLEARKNG